jgi:NADPH-dependent glutamate synthase beta subunit-like oxidoreductase
VQFKCGVEVGVDVSAKDLKASHDALLLTVGSTTPNDLKIPGRELQGVHYAMEFLRKNQYALFTDREGKLKSHWTGEKIDAKGKNVIVIGGGDTGTDCIGTSMRMHCKSLVNFELFPRPPNARAPQNPWPAWPRIYRTDYGHEEAAHVHGADPREFSILSKSFVGADGKLTAIKTVNIRVEAGRLVEIEGSEKEWPCDLVILAMGFKSPEATIPEQLSLDLDTRSNVKAAYGQYQTSLDGVFAAGDCRRGQVRATSGRRAQSSERCERAPGDERAHATQLSFIPSHPIPSHPRALARAQSLVVWAINEGREAAEQVHKYLKAR